MKMHTKRLGLVQKPNFAGNIKPIIAVETPVVWP